MKKVMSRFVAGSLLPSTTSSAANAVRMGNWIYTPALTDEANASLHGNFQRVDLRYSAQPIEDLLTELGRIEAHVTASANSPEEYDNHFGESHGQLSHA